MANVKGGSAAILPEELMLYSFEMPRQHLSPPRVKVLSYEESLLMSSS